MSRQPPRRRNSDPVLAGLDEDLLEYIIQTAAPEGELEIEREDFEEMVPPMLVDAELCADDEAAAALFEELWSAMVLPQSTVLGLQQMNRVPLISIGLDLIHTFHMRL